MGLAGQSWQRHLSAFLDIRPTPPQEIEQMIAARDYQMALIPFAPASAQISSLLGVFTADSRQNHFGYRSWLYDEALSEAPGEHTLSGRAEKYRRTENMLLFDAVVIPVYFETIYYATGSGVTGIEIHPFPNMIYFKYAERQ